MGLKVDFLIGLLILAVVMLSGCTETASNPFAFNEPMNVSMNVSIPDTIKDNSVVPIVLRFHNWGEKENLSCKSVIDFSLASKFMSDIGCEELVGNAEFNFNDRVFEFSLPFGSVETFVINSSMSEIMDRPECNLSLLLLVEIKTDCKGPCDPNRLPRCMPSGSLPTVMKNIEIET